MAGVTGHEPMSATPRAGGALAMAHTAKAGGRADLRATWKRGLSWRDLEVDLV